MSAPVTSAVLCQNISKYFGEATTRVHALRGINFEALTGEVTLLVGPSGCGKTTLLSIITHLLDPSSGKLQVLGQDPSQLSPRDRILFRRKNIGFVFQQFNLIQSLNAQENAAIPLLAAQIPWEEAMQRSADTLVALGLGHRLASMPKTLSGGEQQRVAIARALVHAPSLIVCDEPTSALDGKTGHTVMELLKNQALQPGRAIIVVTHDERIFPFADKIAHMDDGAITHISQSTFNS